MTKPTYVTVGAGLAGAKAAEERRERGFDGRMVLIGDEEEHPYGRPPLSKDRSRTIASSPTTRCCWPRHGVDMLLGRGVEAFEGDGRAVERVRTSDGSRVECDFVVVGVVPRSGLARGLEVENGIMVDERLVSSVPNVYAAGDVANAWHPFYERRLRVEHWANALNQGPAAARSMPGQSVSYERIPYFFSDQYDVEMEYSGYAEHWDEVVFRGDPRAGEEFVAFWLGQGRVMAAAGLAARSQ